MRALVFASIVSLTGSLSGALHAQVPAELRGRVTDAATGRPLGGAEITIQGHAERGEASTDGEFVVRGLEPNRYRLRARALGYLPVERDVDVANGRVTTIDVALRAVVPTLDPVLVRADFDAASPGATTLDRHAIERSGRQDVGELLQIVPAVVLTQQGGPGSPSHISIRGSGSGEVLVIVDGAPVNSALTGTADLSRIALGTVERVTVIPGAQSARYGGHALAGVVLIETRRAERDATASATAGAWGERAGSLSIGNVWDVSGPRVGATLAAQRRDVTGDFSYDVPAVRGGGTARRTNEDVRSSAVLGTTSLETRRTATRARLNWESTERGVAGSIVQPSSTGRSDEDRLAGGLDTRATFGPATLTGALGETHERSHFADADPPFGGRYDDRIDVHETRASATASVGGDAGVLAGGGELRRLGVDASSLAPGAPRAQRFSGAWLSARGAVALGEDLAVTGEAGARLDWDSLLPGTSLSPRVSVTAVRGDASLSVSTGNAFSPPSLADQFFHEGVLVRPNPALAPERVRNEVEVRGAWQHLHVASLDLGADAAVYRANIRGMILWMPDFRFVWSPSNFDVRRSGWEATARAAASAIGAEVRGTINQTDVTYTGSVLSGQVAYRPRTNGSATVALRRPRGHIEITSRYVGERRTVPGSALNALSPYWLTDVMVGAPVTGGTWTTDVTVGLSNLFDRSAAMLVDYPFGGRRWTLGARVHRGTR